MTLRVGVVGCGLIAQRSHLPAFSQMPEATITALASGTRVNAERAAEQFGGEVCDGWQELVGRADVDAVAVCTPNALHAPIAIGAAEAGKHVLVEKPLSTTVADADAMIEAARRAGTTLMVAHNLRYAPPYAAIRDVVASGELGPLYTVRGTFSHAGPDESWGATSSWFFEAEHAGGGAFLDLGIHMIDLVLWTVGRPVLEVAAMTSRVEKPTAAEDNGVVLMRFEGNVLADVQTSWTSRPVGQRRLDVQCAGGQVSLGRSREEPVVVYRHPDGRSVPPIKTAAELGSPFTDFVRAATTGEPPAIPGEAGRDALRVVLAAYESARTGRTVPLPG